MKSAQGYASSYFYDRFYVSSRGSLQTEGYKSGLFLLFESGRIDEIVEASRKIKKRHVEKAKKNLAGFNIRGSPDLKDDEKLILELVKETPEITSGRLYELFQKKGGRMAWSSFRRYCKNS